MPEMMQASQAMEFASRFFHGQDRLKGPLPAELCAASYRAEIAGFPAMDAAGHGQFGTASLTAKSRICGPCSIRWALCANSASCQPSHTA